MKKRNYGAVLACAVLAVLAFILPASAAEPERTAPVMLIPQDAGTHTKYMEGDGERFHPENHVTRAELAQMLVRITADVPESTPAFSDVDPDAWYAPAVGKAAGLGLVNGEDGLFRPGEPATRAECAHALSMMIPFDAQDRLTFPDVQPDHWAYDAICRTAGYGLFQGDNAGNFNPDSGLKRCEVTAVFNRLLGRRPSRETVAQLGPFRFFSDVPADHWAYLDIVEASISHTCVPGPDGLESWTWADVEPIEDPPAPVLTDGPRRVNGRLYWVIDGQYIKNQWLGDFYFDGEGRYTTGLADVDEKLNAIVEQLTNDSMTRDEKLRVLFDYVVDNYTYLKRPLVAKGSRRWEAEYAQFFLKNGKGNCFSFAAAYCLLCRELGLPAYTIVGASGTPNSPHSWVEIPMDNGFYMFDPELQWYYNNRTSLKVDLFKMLPTEIPAGVYRYIW